MKDNNELKKKRIREQDKKKSWKKDEKVFRSKCLIQNLVFGQKNLRVTSFVLLCQRTSTWKALLRTTQS